MENINDEFNGLVRRFTSQLDKLAIAALPPYEGHDRRVVLVDDHNIHLAVHDLS